MAMTIMTYLGFIPAALFAAMIGINIGILLARAAHQDDWARYLQSLLDRTSWVFRMGGGGPRRY